MTGGADFQTLPVEADIDPLTKRLAAAFVREQLGGDDEAVAEVLAALGLDGS